MLGSRGENRGPGSGVRGPEESVQSYRDLIAWRVAMQLVTEVYSVSKKWPREEIYGLTSQVRRAAVSVPSNIAEGRGRQSSNEFRNHLSIAYGSLMELETHIQIAQNLGYQSVEETDSLLSLTARTGQLINGLTKSLPGSRGPGSGVRGPEEVREGDEAYIFDYSYLNLLTTEYANQYTTFNTQHSSPDPGPRTPDPDYSLAGGPQCA